MNAQAGAMIPTLHDESILQLRKYARLQHDSVRACTYLQLPERVVELNSTAALILQCCDGKHTVAEILQLVGARFDSETATAGESEIHNDVKGFLLAAVQQKWVAVTVG